MDQVINALAHDGHIRIIVAETTQLVKEAQRIHDTYPTASAALGRLLSITAIMGSMLKIEHDQITTTIYGDGPLHKSMAVAKSNGDIKGYISNPHVHLINEKTQKLDVAQAIGNGHLEVIKDMSLKHNFISTTDLVSGEIGEDFAHYFTVSEQTPSALSVGVLVDTDNEILSAGALLIQMMPDADEGDILAAEHVITHLKPISQIFHEGQNPKEVALALFEDVEILESRPLQYQCDCSKERTRRALKLLDLSDLKEMVKEDQEVDIECHFCASNYHFDEAELIEIINEKVAHDENKRHKA